MGLSTIIDKSAFQGFSERDLLYLYRYYMPTIPPILVMEILGDLSKEYEGGAAPMEKVRLLANKLLPNNTAVNANYLKLISDEFSGAKITMDYRPFVGDATLLKSSSGQFGMKVTESAEQVAVRRWKDGQFSQIEELMAEFWRKVTKQEDLLEKLKESIHVDPERLKTIRSLSDAADYVDQILLDPACQTDLLTFAVTEFGISTLEAPAIFLRWEQTAVKSLKAFAPYTFFCVRVVLLFHTALKKGLVATRPTNQLDLEYLFYLPFCRIFVTNDKFQKSLAPFFLTDEQQLIVGSELKEDLKAIEEYVQTVGEPADQRRLLKEPPQLSTLLTYKIWNRFFYWPNKLPPPTPKENENARKKMEEIFNAVETGDFSGVESSDDLEFVTIESYLRPTDPCPCGSGKPIKDCHLPPEYEHLR